MELKNKLNREEMEQQELKRLQETYNDYYSEEKDYNNQIVKDFEFQNKLYEYYSAFVMTIRDNERIYFYEGIENFHENIFEPYFGKYVIDLDDERQRDIIINEIFKEFSKNYKISDEDFLKVEINKEIKHVIGRYPDFEEELEEMVEEEDIDLSKKVVNDFKKYLTIDNLIDLSIKLQDKKEENEVKNDENYKYYKKLFETINKFIKEQKEYLQNTNQYSKLKELKEVEQKVLRDADIDKLLKDSFVETKNYYIIDTIKASYDDFMEEAVNSLNLKVKLDSKVTLEDIYELMPKYLIDILDIEFEDGMNINSAFTIPGIEIYTEIFKNIASKYAQKEDGKPYNEKEIMQFLFMNFKSKNKQRRQVLYSEEEIINMSEHDYYDYLIKMKRK